MAYPLENLSDEKFQQLCQSLLVREHEGVQCFPVGQPDGGRDAILKDLSTTSGKFLVYQVKFVRDPNQIDDPRAWLLKTIEDEIPKVRTLVDKSAIGYFLLTNVAGSAHKDVGSIDRMNKLLSERLELPSMCLWRDDLERRLDDAWAIKWAYPEIMTGPDFLRAIIESGVGLDIAWRDSAVRAFLANQFQLDSQVRFRQVGLETRLLDLFVDVPIGITRQSTGTSQYESEFAQLCQWIVRHAPESTTAESEFSDARLDMDDVSSHTPQVGAASFLLTTSAQDEFRNLVLEARQAKENPRFRSTSVK